MFNLRKATEALNYFASKQSNKEIDKLKALKLIWLADRYHARQYGRTITDDTCCAMPLGTVPSNTKGYLDTLQPNNDSALIPIGKYTYKSTRDPNLKVFSKTDLDALNIIFDKFGGMEGKELVKYTHTLPEWKRFESNIKNPQKKSSYPVKIGDIFQNTDDEIGLFNDDDDLLEITEELLLKH